jgi:hydrophobe/amphiphile efflux-3 (HAE3) family protein
MRMKERLERVAGGAAARPVHTVALVLAAAIAGCVFALGLRADTSNGTFVSSGSPSYRATQDYYSHFGADPVVILIREPLPELVETSDLARLTELEACFAGQVVVPNEQLHAFTPAPPGAQAPYGGAGSPCGHLARSKPVQVVYGPGTFLNRAVAAVNQQVAAMLNGIKATVQNAEVAALKVALARHMSRAQALQVATAAGQIAQQQAETQFAQTALESGIVGYPSIDDPQFIPQVVFDQTRGVNQPKARFSYLFPTANSAIVQVRLKPTLSDAQRAQAIGWIRAAVRMPMFRSQYGGQYLVTGAPVFLHDLARQITGSIVGLLIAALIVMAATLLLAFRSRVRLLPLALALAATGITFGATALAGASLTMASVAVLPVLIGLAVDYAIQFQSRTQEAREPGASARAAIGRAAAAGAPTIAAAALATATGFVVLLLSPVPMVRGFGILLVIGIAIAFLCAITAGSAAIVLADRDGGRLRASLRGAAEILADVVRPLGRLVVRARRIRRPSLFRRSALLRRTASGPARTRPSGLIAGAARRPGRVLALAVALAVIGWVADTQTAVQSDVTKLVPSSMSALRDLRTLERVTGVSGEIDVTVKARDITQPKIVSWMIAYEQKLLSHYGYLETKGCARATLCPALSLPDLFSGGAASSGQQGSGTALTQTSIRDLLQAVPPYFSQAVITGDHREATLAFGIRLMPLSRQQHVIDYMRSQLHPPAGVTARLAGLPVLGAQADASLSSSARRLLTLVAGLLAVGLVLRVLLRATDRALIPLIPIALATGWSALLLFVTRIPLNPMSATLGALVIAISTEFSVLLAERFRQERATGLSLGDALTRTYSSTGAAVLASGITAIAGFGVLIFSNITMLRDFGVVTLIDLTVSLGGVLLVLPAVLALAERGDVIAGVLGLPRRVRRPGLRPRRRRARVA